MNNFMSRRIRAQLHFFATYIYLKLYKIPTAVFNTVCSGVENQCRELVPQGEHRFITLLDLG